jgi:hypothetical protein
LISAYGDGAPPVIQNASNEIIVAGSYLTFDGLSFRSDPERVDAGCDNQSVGRRTGVLLGPTAHDDRVVNSRFTSLSTGVWVRPGAHHNQVSGNDFTDVNMMLTLTPKNVHGNDDSGADAFLVEGDDNDIAYNTISGAMACSYDYGSDGAAVEIYGGAGNAVHHNVVRDSTLFAEVSLGSAVNNVFSYNLANGHAGLTLHAEPSRTVVYNNIFFSVGGAGDNGIVCASCSARSLTFKNNIVWAYGGVQTAGSPFDEDDNIYWSPSGNPHLDFAISPTSRIADPRFVSPGVDFHLLSDSPALASGTLESFDAGWTTDLDGAGVGDGAVNIGAYGRGS